MNLKKLERYLGVNLLELGRRLMKNNLPDRGLTKVEKQCCRGNDTSNARLYRTFVYSWYFQFRIAVCSGGEKEILVPVYLNCVLGISWSLYVTGGRSRTDGLILYQIAVRTVVKLVVMSANIATLRVRYAPMVQCVENVVSETLNAWKELVSTWNYCWNSLIIGA